ncbi:MAG TPA: DUF1674 domain-containing protein [Rhizobiaceae bacterium]|nr:DUF1674 domain-containing protein [Rhizobiaceae bacterium]
MDGGNEDHGADGETGRELPAAAIRALAEAAERRRAMDARPSLPPEVNGRDGPEPVRYGDWERKGIAVDF